MEKSMQSENMKDIYSKNAEKIKGSLSLPDGYLVTALDDGVLIDNGLADGKGALGFAVTAQDIDSVQLEIVKKTLDKLISVTGTPEGLRLSLIGRRNELQ